MQSIPGLYPLSVIKFAYLPLSEEVNLDEFEKVASKFGNDVLVAEVNFESNDDQVNELAERFEVENNGLPVFYLLKFDNNGEQVQSLRFGYEEFNAKHVRVFMCLLIDECLTPFAKDALKLVKREVNSNEVTDHQLPTSNLSTLFKFLNEHPQMNVDEAKIDALFNNDEEDEPFSVFYTLKDGNIRNLNSTFHDFEFALEHIFELLKRKSGLYLHWGPKGMMESDKNVLYVNEWNKNEVIEKKDELILGMNGQELIIVISALGALIAGTLNSLLVENLLFGVFVSIVAFIL